MTQIAVRYQSRNGNTKAMAEEIAECLDVSAEPLDVPLPEHVDILFLGGGVYRWDADESLIHYLEEIGDHDIGTVVPFSTAGGMLATIRRISEYTRKAGIGVSGDSLCLKLLMQEHPGHRKEGGYLTSDQISQIREFANEAVSHAC